MFKAIEGIFRNGKVELLEPPPNTDDVRVLVTFLSSSAVNLAERGINAVEAAELRSRFGAAIEDWDRPEMDIYDEL